MPWDMKCHKQWRYWYQKNHLDQKNSLTTFHMKYSIFLGNFEQKKTFVF